MLTRTIDVLYLFNISTIYIYIPYGSHTDHPWDIEKETEALARLEASTSRWDEKKTLGFGDDIFGDTFIYNRHEPWIYTLW